MERYLVWYLESNKLLTNVQCGFRSRRSTVDHLVRFETFCWEAFIHNQHLVSVFFDLEKAYDTTWKYGIMKDLHGFGRRGRLPQLFLDKSPIPVVEVIFDRKLSFVPHLKYVKKEA